MRILLSCLQSLKRHRLPAYGFWRSYFVHGLLEAGHEVVEVPNVDWVEGITYPNGNELDSWRSRTWEIVNTFVQRELTKRPLHLFVGYLYPKQVEVSAIRDFQQRGIPCVNFFCDNVRQYVKPPAEYAPFALHWVPEFEALRMYRKASLPFIHAPMPCWISEELRNLAFLETEPPTFPRLGRHSASRSTWSRPRAWFRFHHKGTRMAQQWGHERTDHRETHSIKHSKESNRSREAARDFAVF